MRLANGRFIAFCLTTIQALRAEQLIYGVQIEQLEHRYINDQSNVLAWGIGRSRISTTMV